MKSLQSRFDEQQRKRPSHSTFLNFASAVKGQGFHDAVVRRWFNKLVDKDDYAPEEKRDHLQFFYALTKKSRGVPHLRGNLAPDERKHHIGKNVHIHKGRVGGKVEWLTGFNVRQSCTAL